jgi:hypothetical protein
MCNVLQFLSSSACSLLPQTDFVLAECIGGGGWAPADVHHVQVLLRPKGPGVKSQA